MESAALSPEVSETELDGNLSAIQRRVGISTTIKLTLFAILLLYTGWLNSTQTVWTTEAGWGFWIAVAGGSMMILLLSYPMHKCMQFIHKWLTSEFWFRTHRVLGVLGLKYRLTLPWKAGIAVSTALPAIGYC